MFAELLAGLLNVLHPIYLIALFFGVLIGFFGGATPGISGTMLVIILIPITYGMDTTSAFLILTAIYATAVFSGSISAILFRTPGAPEAVATVFDGYPMARRGEAGKALGIAIFSSASGGLIGTLILIFLTPYLAKVALEFAAPEYFALAFLGLTVVAALSNKQVIKGLIGVLFGLFIATIGIDSMSGVQRFTFDMPKLTGGINFIPILIGLFAVSEVLRRAQQDHAIKEQIKKVTSKIPGLNLIKSLTATIGRSSIIGTMIGILPGAGATTAAMMCYSEAVRWSKHPKKFGTGVPEGIAAPESGNNAAAMGAMVPLLALGIPGSATTAVILGAFILHGIQPGPLLITNNSQLVYSIFIGLLLSIIFILVLAKPFIMLFAQVLKIPYYYLGPVILMFCIIGTFAIRNNVFDLWVMFAFGVLGYFLEKAKFPIAPIVLGVVLGPLAEDQFRRAVQMAGGDFLVFFNRPISATLIVLALLSLFYPLIKSLLSRRKRENQTFGA
ncbi:putative tricarboxylic transport membrane protein [Caldalkalibacillus uzonensis]|uniref:Tricarboxylic transport membrane protein n=1 Tax=Caldalkalibacillus uzonensis TaxID=353224 RepID=A0ABU0CP49_9BACI|nr:tripartite tricarboxylate transporter permease [Caldalkalibacillus uzonensis]MDQ0338188.1 putative tricarboxylic transport membrane protein [Caldalkalibacillus uzonensis]